MYWCWKYIFLKSAIWKLTIDISIKYSIKSVENRYIYKVPKTCIVHVFGVDITFTFYQMTCCMSYYYISGKFLGVYDSTFVMAIYTYRSSYVNSILLLFLQRTYTC